MGTTLLLSAAADGTNGATPAAAVFGATVPKWTSTDTDGDDLDDEWEPSGSGDLSHDGTADSDADGFSDRTEYLTGTDLTDPRSKMSRSGHRVQD